VAGGPKRIENEIPLDPFTAGVFAAPPATTTSIPCSATTPLTREGRVSSVTLLRRLGNYSHKNRLYRALREMGRVIRTVTLLRYLSDPGLREQITAVTNKTEAFHGYSEWLMIRGKSATTIPSTSSG
jgi:hypothetical protein